MASPRLSPHLAGVRCFSCDLPHDPLTLLTVCTRCGLPLRVDYDLSNVRLKLSDLAGRPPTLWRYREMLPLQAGDEVSLAEGFTPLLKVGANVWVKDEARNPTGSFKARGMALAVSMAKHLGAQAMAYELVEQFDGQTPDVVLYPTGGGTGLVGMWKAFDEMETLGWIAPGRRPRFASVQAEGCAPVAKAFHEHSERTEAWPNPHTEAYGLRVPSPLGGFLCLRALRDTHGTAVTIDEDSMKRATQSLAALAGIDVCPEGGAAWAALDRLRESGFVRPTDTVVVFNTGTGLKYR